MPKHADKYYDPHLASYLYYTIRELPDGEVAVNGFTRNERAEKYQKEHGGIIIRHSKRALSELSMTLLMKIVRAGTRNHPKPPKVTQMGRVDLVHAAFSYLWSALGETGRLEGDPKPQSQQEDGMATTVGKGPKVREIREGGAKAAKGEKATKAPKAAKGDGEKKAAGPRANDEFTGKKLYLVGEENPRREGTHGHRSMEVIRKKPGISYEDYLSAGGRRVDLKGSLELKQVEVKS